jgi:hypothetical protein
LGTVFFLVIPSVHIKNRPRNYGSYVEINYWTMVSGCLITGEGIHGMIRCLWPAVVIVDWDSFHHFSRLVRQFLRPTHLSWNSLHVEWSSRRSLHVRLSFFWSNQLWRASTTLYSTTLSFHLFQPDVA